MRSMSGTASARPRTPRRTVIARLNGAINAVLADPKMKARFAELGGTALGGSPADFAQFIAAEVDKWGKVVRAANLKPE